MSKTMKTKKNETTESKTTKMPRKITCSKCGEIKGVRPEVLEKRIPKYGTLEKLLKGYICRDCSPKVEKKATKKGEKKVSKPKTDLVKKMEAGELFWQKPGEIPFNEKRLITEMEKTVKKVTKKVA